MSLIALIPARGGSKGISRKNLVDLGGKPLIAWSIEVGLAMEEVDRVVVSTDDDEIASVARHHGADVPFIRPAALAADDSTDEEVYHHALGELNRDGAPVEILVWLRPTCPFRSVDDIGEGLRLIRTAGADLVRSVCAVEHHPYWMKQLDGTRLKPFMEGKDERRFPRRQLLPPCYRLNGAVDVFVVRGRSGGLYGGDMRGFVMPPERSVDIDTPFDLAFARALVAATRYPDTVRSENEAPDWLPTPHRRDE